MRILIALDDSAHSNRALDFVTRIRWPAGSRVIVLTTLRPTAAMSAAAELIERAECTLRESGFSTEGRVLDGDPREALVQVAKSERADLLVVGSRDRTGVTKSLLGSVSSHVVTHAPCSVLVVKETQTHAAPRNPQPST